VSKRAATYGFAAVVLSIVGILVVPLPPALLDALLAINILGSGLVLLLAITIADPLEFAAFAPVLLLATLFRLALDVSATRLILTQGHDPGGVGAVIPAFGAFVVRGNIVVGLIVFAILITIQFIVIATGAQRVAEVSARFTLDAMPGKQMAIDADVHAGVLDADTHAQVLDAARQLEAQHRVRLNIVIVRTLNGQSAQAVSTAIANNWESRHTASQRSVQIFLDIDERKMRFDICQNLEKIITDPDASNFQQDMTPMLHEGDYGRALLSAAQNLSDLVAQKDQAPPTANAPRPAPAPPQAPPPNAPPSSN